MLRRGRSQRKIEAKRQAKAAASGFKPKRLEQRLNAILRALYIDLEALPYPERLLAQRFNMYAQNEEDGLVLALLKEVGIATRSFVEIGCGENGGNSGFLALELGFSGLMLDGDERRLQAARQRFDPERIVIRPAFVTRENVNELIEREGFAGEVDFLSIDVDGNDAWLLEALEVVSPRVVAVEYNSLLGPDRAVTIPYAPQFERRAVKPTEVIRARYYGVSLRGADVVARRKGYRLVVVEPRGTNAFFVRDDLAPHIPALEPGAAFRRLNKHQDMLDEGFDVYALAAKHELPLVDLTAE